MRSYNLWLDLYLNHTPCSIVWKNQNPDLSLPESLLGDFGLSEEGFVETNPPCFEFKRRVFHQKLLEFSALPSENRATPFHPVVCLNPHVYPMFFGAMVLNPPSFQVFQPAAPRAVQPPLQHLPRCWRSNAKGRRWLFWSCDNGWSWGRQGHPKGDQKRRKPRATKGGVVMAFLGSRWILGGWDSYESRPSRRSYLFHLRGGHCRALTNTGWGDGIW